MLRNERNALEDLYETADAFLNVTGAQEMRAEHLRFRDGFTSSPIRLRHKLKWPTAMRR